MSDFIRHQCDERNVELAQKNDLNISVDPEILNVIRNSTAISIHKGSSVGLLKIGSKRRRTKAELAELQQEEARRLAEFERHDDIVRELRA
jgi:hypothetical protein